MGNTSGIKISYTTTVAKGLKKHLEKNIINAIEGDKEMRKEIARVFQQANRRIQNVEKSGVFSPAVASLGKGDIKNYSKFSVKGFGNSGADWKALKKEYAKAVSFLNQPTSTASGAKQFEKQVKSQMNVTDDLWKGIRDSVLGNYNSVSSDLLLALPYADFIQDIYDKARDSSSKMIEQDAKAISDEIQDNINKTADIMATSLSNAIEEMAKGFKIDF